MAPEALGGPRNYANFKDTCPPDVAELLASLEKVSIRFSPLLPRAGIGACRAVLPSMLNEKANAMDPKAAWHGVMPNAVAELGLKL